MGRGTRVSSASMAPGADVPLLRDWASGRGMVCEFLGGIQGGLKCKPRLAVLVKEAVAGVSLLSHCPVPLSGKALLHVHAKINYGIALG